MCQYLKNKPLSNFFLTNLYFFDLRQFLESEELIQKKKCLSTCKSNLHALKSRLKSTSNAPKLGLYLYKPQWHTSTTVVGKGTLNPKVRPILTHTPRLSSFLPLYWSYNGMTKFQQYTTVSLLLAQFFRLGKTTMEAKYRVDRRLNQY